MVESMGMLLEAFNVAAGGISIIDYSNGVNNGADVDQAATAEGGQVGDYLLVYHETEWDNQVNMTAPTVTVGGSASAISFTNHVTANSGVNQLHTKVWGGYIVNAGDQVVTVNGITGSANQLETLILRGVHASSPISGTPTSNFSTTAGMTATATGLTPAHDNCLLVASGQCNDDNGDVVLTVPSGMTAQTQVVGTFQSGRLATLQLGAAGATGNKDYTISTSQKWATTLLALRPA